MVKETKEDFKRVRRGGLTEDERPQESQDRYKSLMLLHKKIVKLNKHNCF